MAPRNPYGGSNVPSQAPSPRVPYAPTVQPDIAVSEDMRGAKPIGYPAKGNYVIAVYDSRLPETIDFDTELSSVLSDDSDPINRTRVSFVVPEGRTLVIKNFGVAVDQRLDGSSTPTENMTRGGFSSQFPQNNPNSVPRITLFIDGTPVENYSDIILSDLTLNYHMFESFILVRGGSTVTLQCIFSTTFGDDVPHRAFWKVYGNELLTKGDDIVQEPTNTDAVPVKAGFFSRLAGAIERLAGNA